MKYWQNLYMAIMVIDQGQVKKDILTAFNFFLLRFGVYCYYYFCRYRSSILQLYHCLAFFSLLNFGSNIILNNNNKKKTTTTNSSCCPLADGGHSSSSMYSSNTQEVSNTSMANRYKKIKEKFQKEKIKSCHQCCTAAGHRMVGFVRTHTHILFWQYCMRTHTKKSLVLVFEVMQNPINFFGIMSQC